MVQERIGLLRHFANRPFPSSLVPLFQSESKCETILMKKTLICMKMKLLAKTHFHMKGFALRHVIVKLVYLNGNNAAEGENNIKYANSYPMN